MISAVLFRASRTANGEPHEQAYFPTQQPSSRKGPRLPPAYAYPCWSRNLVGTSPQGPHRAFRVNQVVLRRAHRIVNPLDYKRVVRRGRRHTGQFMIVHVNAAAQSDPRAGFIVSKIVGGAAVRNLVKRRLRAATAPLLPSASGDIVVRALPASATATFADLRSELEALLLPSQPQGRR